MPGKPSRRRPRCAGLTHAGDQCKKPAAVGSKHCGVHGGARRKVGAPLKISRDLIDTIVKSIRAGATYDVAAQAAGVHRSTLIAWREHGELDLENSTDSLFAYFADELTRATAVGELTLVQRISAHGLVDWRAAAWLLERRHPERWARRDRLDVAVSERAKPRTVEPPEDKRDTILEILRTATQAPAGADDDR